MNTQPEQSQTNKGLTVATIIAVSLYIVIMGSLVGLFAVVCR